MNSENNVQGVEERSTMADLKNNFFYANWMIAQKVRHPRKKLDIPNSNPSSI